MGDAHEAEELAQEAFTRAYLNLGRLDGERKFYPWVTVIAGRLCVDAHRRRARTEPRDDIDPGPVDGGQEAVLDLEAMAALRGAIRRLTPRQQEVLELRAHRGYSYQRIAEQVGVSSGNVDALLCRARRTLRQEFHLLTVGAPD
jgi:RNA polymerase sigma-70 factor (ECF subfamily)